MADRVLGMFLGSFSNAFRTSKGPHLSLLFNQAMWVVYEMAVLGRIDGTNGTTWWFWEELMVRTAPPLRDL